VSRGCSSAGAYRGGMGVTAGVEASVSGNETRIGKENGNRDQRERVRGSNDTETIQPESKRGRETDQTGK
jgi:hypothetical protein